MIPTYKARGIVRALGKALGLPLDEVGALARGLETNSVSDLYNSPALLARADRPGWRDLLALSEQLAGFPKGLAQHPGGMLVSSTPLTDLAPVQPSAIAGRYVTHWDKDSVDDAGVLKIDLLALGTLSQMQQAVRLARDRTGTEPGLSRIDYRDPRRLRRPGPGQHRGRVPGGVRRPDADHSCGRSPGTSTSWPWRWRQCGPEWAPTTAWPSSCAAGRVCPGITLIPWNGTHWSGLWASSCFRTRWCSWAWTWAGSPPPMPTGCAALSVVAMARLWWSPIAGSFWPAP